MNREQRRASQYKRTQWSRNDVMSHPSAGMNRLLLAKPYCVEDAARLSVMARMAWHKLTHGDGTQQDFDTLGEMINVANVVATDNDADELVQEIFDRAILSMSGMRARYERIGKFGADAHALEYVPQVLDAIDVVFANITPLQAVGALRKSMAMVRQQGAPSFDTNGPI